MYEDQTYEVILKRLIDRAHEYSPNLDDREGSLLFNALAPAAMEIAILYTELDNLRYESFIRSASREYLFIACEDMGIPTDQFNATFGVFRGEFDVEVETGSVWNCDIYNFTVNEFIESYEDDGVTKHAYKLMCDTPGTAANNITGDLTPISDAPQGLSYAAIMTCLVEGENEATDDQIRETYYEYVSNTVSDGNVAYYRRLCDEYTGIGHYKIVPLWNGANTVKISILTASNRAVNTSTTPNLVSEFQEYMDPVDGNGDPTGMGDGAALIGAFVTVDTATEVPVNISATVKFAEGYSDTTALDDAVTKFFSDMAYRKSAVVYMSLGAAIDAVEGVDFISNLAIGTSTTLGTSDIALTTYQIPVKGTTTWTVASDDV